MTILPIFEVAHQLQRGHEIIGVDASLLAKVYDGTNCLIKFELYFLLPFKQISFSLHVLK